MSNKRSHRGRRFDRERKAAARAKYAALAPFTGPLNIDRLTAEVHAAHNRRLHPYLDVYERTA